MFSEAVCVSEPLLYKSAGGRMRLWRESMTLCYYDPFFFFSQSTMIPVAVSCHPSGVSKNQWNKRALFDFLHPTGVQFLFLTLMLAVDLFWSEANIRLCVPLTKPSRTQQPRAWMSIRASAALRFVQGVSRLNLDAITYHLLHFDFKITQRVMSLDEEQCRSKGNTSGVARERRRREPQGGSGRI